MSSQQKDIELSPVKAGTSPKPPEPVETLHLPVNDEEDVIIGRFRKISSAKSMAATNGNIQYPAELLPKPEDLESGLHFKNKEAGEKDRLLADPVVNGGVIVQPAKSPMTKSSFRDMEKPSRFKDHPSATRFQVSSKLNCYLLGQARIGKVRAWNYPTKIRWKKIMLNGKILIMSY